MSRPSVLPRPACGRIRAARPAGAGLGLFAAPVLNFCPLAAAELPDRPALACRDKPRDQRLHLVSDSRCAGVPAPVRFGSSRQMVLPHIVQHSQIGADTAQLQPCASPSSGGTGSILLLRGRGLQPFTRMPLSQPRKAVRQRRQVAKFSEIAPAQSSCRNTYQCPLRSVRLGLTVRQIGHAPSGDLTPQLIIPQQSQIAESSDRP